MEFWNERNQQKFFSANRDQLDADEQCLLSLILRADASTVLEIGAGYGRILKQMAHRFPHCFGIEVSYRL